MADNLLISLVKSIRDSEVAKLTVHTTTGAELILDCVYKESVAPNFFIVPTAGEFPTNIDVNHPCTLSIHSNSGESLALAAKIAEITSRRSIELTAAKTIDPASLREYFRVDIRLPITISFKTKSDEESPRNWTLHGHTLDLSATGVLGLFPDECRTRQDIIIEIRLANPKTNIVCTGHVVRTYRTRSGRWHIALHFDDFVQGERDTIISNCLWEQRRQLREKTQTAG